MLGAVAALNERDGRNLSSPIAIAKATAYLTETVPAGDLEEAWHRRAAMTLEEAAALALAGDEKTP